VTLDPILLVHKAYTKLVLAIKLLQNPLYRNYWLALFLSQMGTWMQAATQGWLVLEITNSAERLGLVIALQSIPSLLFSIPAGILSDRYPKRNLLLITQIGMAVCALAMFALTASGYIQYWHVLFFAFLYGLFNAIDLPARQAFTVEIATKTYYPGAIALNSFGFNVSRVVGPALAGLSIAALGLEWSYLVNTLSYLPLVGVLWAVRSTAGSGNNDNPLAGVQYVLQEPLIRQVVLLVGLSSLFGMNFQTIVPSYARLELAMGAKEFGLLMSAVGLGSIVAALVQAARSKARPVLSLYGSVVLAVSLMCLALPVSVGWVALFLALGGMGMIATVINANTTVQMTVPDHLRGRVMSVYSMVLLGVSPLGAYLAGFFIELCGARWGVAIMGLLTLVSVLAMTQFAWSKTVSAASD
jgi:MFS family permease